MKFTDTHITINRLEIYAHHGVNPQERVVGNTFYVTLSLWYDATDAMVSDSLTVALNYADVIELIREEMQTPSALLEHVAKGIADKLQEQFSFITRGSLTITKAKPPVASPVDGVSFTLNWEA